MGTLSLPPLPTRRGRVLAASLAFLADPRYELILRGNPPYSYRIHLRRVTHVTNTPLAFNS